MNHNRFPYEIRIGRRFFMFRTEDMLMKGMIYMERNDHSSIRQYAYLSIEFGEITKDKSRNPWHKRDQEYIDYLCELTK